MTECEHKWVFQGTVYWTGPGMAGTGAHHRIYGDRFFCERCLETKVINERYVGDTYMKPIEGTLPR